MSEPERAPGGVRHEQAALDGLAQRFHKVVRVVGHDRGQQPVRDFAGGRCSHSEHRTRLASELVEALEQHITEKAREGLVAVACGREQLLREERVPLGPGTDGRDECRVERLV